MVSQQDNKRIAKNTIFLYFRMFLVMVVTLYTSRIVLQQLGDDDYGIYSVIGGVVTLITFFNQAMSTSTQRYITYEIGKVNGDVSKVFSTCFNIHLWIAITAVILAETVGLWFVNNRMNFPIGSYTDVNWTYQLSILMCVASIVRFPYNALVLAYEKMKFFAYNSVVEVLMKLGIVYLLILSPKEKLILYMGLLTIVTFLMTAWYVFYCLKNFPNVKIVRVSDKKGYKEIVSFSGWATFGSLANVGYQQGIAIIINIFYGVVTNAALGIATQVNTAVSQFVSGFQQALNPQLIKSHASEDKSRQLELIYASSKFSFLIMLLVSYPLMCNIDYVLHLWLGNYPANTNIFAVLIIAGALLETLSGPLWVTIFATGRIKAYQIAVSSLLIINVPAAYMVGFLDMPVWFIFIVRIFIFAGALGLRLTFLRRMIGLNIVHFFNKVLTPLMIICLVLSLNYYCVRWYLFSEAQTFPELLCQTVYFFLFTLILECYIGLTRVQFRKIRGLIVSRFK